MNVVAQNNAVSCDDMKQMALRLRAKVVEMSYRAQTPHLGSALSCVDILVAAYWGGVLSVDPAVPSTPDRDRIILSKGHAVSALYAALAFRGYFSCALLDTFNQDGGCLPEQPTPGCVPGLELATGSLGHGLPFGLGLALAARIQRREYRVLVVMSDGECNEGSVWEAALMAPAQGVDNLCAVVDYNKWQATGRSNEIMALEPLIDKWRSFGWNACERDGHDIEALCEAMHNGFGRNGRPSVVVAHTVKGKGVSFMEDDNNWHYRSPNADELAAAIEELRPS